MRLAALLLCLATPALAQESRPFSSAPGVDCVEAWQVEVVTRLNRHHGPGGWNAGKPYVMSRFGTVVAHDAPRVRPPEGWAALDGDRMAVMWDRLYPSEASWPRWRDRDWRAARVPGLRAFVRACLAGGGAPARPEVPDLVPVPQVPVAPPGTSVLSTERPPDAPPAPGTTVIRSAPARP